MEKVGDDIFAVCGKCGEVWHVVVAKVAAKIVKVQCKECSAYHRYRPAGRVAKTTRPLSRAKRTKAAAAQEAAAAQALVEPDLSRPIRDYVMSDTFSSGDRILHASFGIGVVEAVTAPGKIQVFFTAGRRLLVHQRSA